MASVTQIFKFNVDLLAREIDLAENDLSDDARDFIKTKKAIGVHVGVDEVHRINSHFQKGPKDIQESVQNLQKVKNHIQQLLKDFKIRPKCPILVENTINPEKGIFPLYEAG